MITKEVYMEIAVLRKHGMSLRRIVAEVGCAVNFVRRHLETGHALRYERQQKRPTKLTAFESYLQDRQRATHSCGYLQHEAVDGRQGRLARRRIRGTAVEECQVRSGVPVRLRDGVRCQGGYLALC